MEILLIDGIETVGVEYICDKFYLSKGCVWTLRNRGKLDKFITIHSFRHYYPYDKKALDAYWKEITPVEFQYDECEWVSTWYAAKVIGVPVGTLRQWRHRGKCPEGHPNYIWRRAFTHVQYLRFYFP